MSHPVVRTSVVFAALVLGAARLAGAQTCVVIDESRDTLTREERVAAVLLVRKQFDDAGHRTAEANCAGTYSLSHIRLGTTIIVTLSGPLGSRDGKALGLDDLPPVYSQLVRSLTTGEPMGTLAVLDRTNVSAAQDLPARRVASDGFWHARVGYASLFARDAQSAASFGFGYRAAFEHIGLDVSFLNFQVGNEGGYYGSNGSAFSLVKLEGLYYTNPKGNRSFFGGGGLSYGRTHVSIMGSEGYPTYAEGSGLQGELTVGYEIARVTSARFFTQADITLPFYNVTYERYSFPSGPPVPGRYTAPTITTERQYAPSLALSIGIGWQRRR